jgi:cell wall-associated NlpC family hydrolase
MGHGRVSAAVALGLALAIGSAAPAAADITGGASPVVHTGGAAPGDVPPPLPPAGSRAATLENGVARAPAGAPVAVRRVIAAGNKLQDKPYRYGGGHGAFADTGYDCSGTVSFALHGGRLLRAPLNSTGFETWGKAGPGSWITVYANAGHAYMVVAGLRLDTSGTNGRGPRWQTLSRPSTGFVARHPAGL